MCRVECLHEVHFRDPHFETPLTAFLFQQSVCDKMIQRLVRTSKHSLVFRLRLVESAVKSLLNMIVENSLYIAGRV